MIKHIVCVKLKDNSIENCEKVKELLLSMNGNVPMIENLEVGIDFVNAKQSYDIYLQVEVADREQLNAYINDRYHCDVVKKSLSDYVSSLITVDYEC